jgi:hypothetical protein
MKNVWQWMVGAGAVISLLGAAAWGVPHYIKTMVADEVAAVLDERSALKGKSTEVIDLERRDAEILVALEAIKSGQQEIKITQREFANIFTAYLERQAR